MVRVGVGPGSLKTRIDRQLDLWKGERSHLLLDVLVIQIIHCSGDFFSAFCDMEVRRESSPRRLMIDAGDDERLTGVLRPAGGRDRRDARSAVGRFIPAGPAAAVARAGRPRPDRRRAAGRRAGNRTGAGTDKRSGRDGRAGWKTDQHGLAPPDRAGPPRPSPGPTARGLGGLATHGRTLPDPAVPGAGRRRESCPDGLAVKVIEQCPRSGPLAQTG
jgi:hypothetical protein